MLPPLLTRLLGQSRVQNPWWMQQDILMMFFSGAPIWLGKGQQHNSAPEWRPAGVGPNCHLAISLL